MSILANKKLLIVSSFIFVAFFACLNTQNASAGYATICKLGKAGTFGSWPGYTNYYTADGQDAMCSEAEKAAVQGCNSMYYYESWDTDMKMVLMLSPIGPLSGRYGSTYTYGSNAYAIYHSILSYANNGSYGANGGGVYGWNSGDYWRMQSDINGMRNWFYNHSDAYALLDEYVLNITEATEPFGLQRFAWLEHVYVPTWESQDRTVVDAKYTMTGTISPQVYDNGWVDIGNGTTYYAKSKTTSFRYKYQVNGSYPKYCFYGAGGASSCTPYDTASGVRYSNSFDITLDAGQKSQNKYGYNKYVTTYTCVHSYTDWYYGGVYQYTNDNGVTCSYSGSNTVSAYFSVFLPYNFDTTVESSMGNNLVPTYPGETVTSTIKTSVDKYDPNYYGPATPGDATIRIIYFIVPSTVAYNNTITKGSSSSNTEPCAFYKGKNSSIKKCTYTDRTVSTYTGNYQSTYTVPDDADVGTKICVAAGIKPSYGVPSTNTVYNTWRISDASCRYIAKNPNLQIWGASFYTAGNATTSVTVRKKASNGTKTVYSSWDEFAAIAKGDIKGFSSGNMTGYTTYPTAGGLYIGTGNDNFCNLTANNNRSPLSIANMGCANATGNSGIALDNTIVDKVISRYAKAQEKVSSGNVNLGSTAVYTQPSGSKVRYTYSTGNITINNASQLSNGITHVVYAKGDVTINTNNLSYNNGPYTKAEDIPQYLIIADGNININAGVSTINAWLIAKNGVIDTCAGYSVGTTGTYGLSADNCNAKLTINGPVFAKRLVTNRTANGDPGANTGFIAAEVFNLPSYTYYWAYTRASDESQAYATYIREMAPRY